MTRTDIHCVTVQQSRKCRGVLEVELDFRSDRNSTGR